MFCRYMTALLIMIIFTTFFFYYNTVFCGVYPRASVGWVYSGLWCLMLVWFAFSPFIILILTVIEYNALSSGCFDCLRRYFAYPLEFMF